MKFAAEPIYPDVLGFITGGTRFNIEALQCAIGIFPLQTYINQPVEVVLILQNMVDQNMQVRVGVQVPDEDKNGNLVVVDIPRKTLSLGLRPGEVGVLRIPIIPRPPTPAVRQLPVRVAVRYRTPQAGKRVRPIAGAPPPSILSVSALKLQVLRDVHFAAQTWHDSTDILTTFFDIAPRIMPDIHHNLQPKYESLWTHEELITDQQSNAAAHVNDAYRVASRLTRTAVFQSLMDAVDKRFADRGLPLHPGESMAIAKMMTYTLDEGLDLEPGFSLEESNWFRTVCYLLAYDETLEDMDRGDFVVQYLFESVLVDAIMLGFGVIESHVHEDLGDHAERLAYAHRVLSWVAGQGQPDVSYAYLPLIMGAIVVNELTTVKPDNPWNMMYLLREAVSGRERLFTGDNAPIFNMTADLIIFGEDSLRRAHVPPP